MARSPRGEAAVLLSLVNQHRSARGLRVLSLNRKLRRTARYRAITLAARRILSHDGWVAAMRRSGYFALSSTVGENIAVGQPSVTATFQAWLNSPDHRRNIEDRDYREMGFARVGTYRVQTFGAQR